LSRMILAKEAARYLVFGIAASVAACWVVGKGQRPAINRAMVARAVVAALLGLATVSVVQHFYAHPCPFVERQDVTLLLNYGADPSFPSEHAVVAFSLAGAALWSRRLLLASSLLVAAAALGVARIYTGLHYPSDIGAAAGVGLLASFLIVGLAGPLTIRLRTAVAGALPPAVRTLLD
jgi:undecaprenyl-diphosphatase